MANPPSRFHFFAGKGGVGKTTCAVNYALAPRRSGARGAKTLVVSTDPAHSLGDVLGIRLGATPRAVGERVEAVELDAPRAFARWLTTNRRALTDILERGTWLDRIDAAALLDLTIPGVDELAGLSEISALAGGPYARVVVDTAPTGHTLRLLAAPAAVAVVAGVLDALEEEHRIIRARFAGINREDAADRLITMLTSQAADVAALLRDKARTVFHWVTLAEPLAVAETDDGLAALADADLRVAEIVVNRLWPPGPRCRICDPRRASERAALTLLRSRSGKDQSIRLVAERLPAARPSKGPTTAATTTSMKQLVGSTRLVFVGGKGGVGKTTVAAAVALRAAQASPGESVLLLSTDPAHSLGDVFDTALGDDAQPVPGGPPNLVVRELDAARALALRRGELEAALDDVGDGVATGAAQAKQLMDLAPPGVDELFGMLTILDARSQHSTIVVDTAPTGHALRLLEMPEAARQWVQTLLRVLLKYKAVVRPGRLATELVQASQSIRQLQTILRDASVTRFLVVTRAESAARAETERLLRRLRTLKLRAPTVIVNARTLAPGCRLCRSAAEGEAREVRSLRRALGTGRSACAIIQTPLVAPPPRGAAALEKWAGDWLL